MSDDTRPEPPPGHHWPKDGEATRCLNCGQPTLIYVVDTCDYCVPPPPRDLTDNTRLLEQDAEALVRTCHRDGPDTDEFRSDLRRLEGTLRERRR